MTNHEPPTVAEPPAIASSLPAAIILSVGGWSGIWYLMNQTLPTLWPRWFFFAAIVVAITGTTLPIVAFLNRRFSTNEPVNFSIIVREAMWVGVYAAVLIWLNKGRVLNSGLAVVLGFGFLFSEALMRARSLTQWQPGEK